MTPASLPQGAAGLPPGDAGLRRGESGRRPARMGSLALLLAFAVLVAAEAPGTTPPVADEIAVPEALQEFWDAYREARLAGEDAEVDIVVRTKVDLAERTLDFLLNEYCSRPTADYELEGEVRQLAWSLDRVGGQERFIARVRLVTNLEVNDRRNRVRAILRYDDGLALLQTARFERDPEQLALAEAAFLESAMALEQIGDAELACFSYQKAAEVARVQERWDDMERSLQKVVDLAGTLGFDLGVASSARAMLGDLARLRAGESVDVGSGLDEQAGSGRGLDSYAAGSEERTLPLEFVAPRKDMPDDGIVTFAPFDQDYSWTQTAISGDGPVKFDDWRGARLQPFEAPLMITRDGASYGFDADGDGEADVELAVSSTPKRVIVPAPDGGHPYALLVSTPAEGETMFETIVNYSPTTDHARLRFHTGGWLETEFEGEPLRILDTDLDGRYGSGGFLASGDGVTFAPADTWLDFYELDSVQVGKKPERAMPWSSVLPLGDGFYRAYVGARGAGMTLREMKLDTGHVLLEMETDVEPAFLVIRETDQLPGAFFNVVPGKRGAPVAVPAGTYEIAAGQLEAGKKQGRSLARVYKGRAPVFTVAAGETTTLQLGAPFQLTAQLVEEGEETVLDTRTLRIFGRGGEEYAMLLNDPLQPTVAVRTREGKKLGKPEKLRKAGYEEWDRNAQASGPDNVLWFPAEFRIENEKHEPLQVRLEQKKHKLLGGPFDSGWIPE